VNAGVIVSELKFGRVFESADNSFEGLEMLHALETVESLERDRLVLGATGQAEEILVLGKIRVGKIKLDLRNLGELMLNIAI